MDKVKQVIVFLFINFDQNGKHLTVGVNFKFLHSCYELPAIIENRGNMFVYSNL